MKGLAIEITERLDRELRQAAQKGNAKSLRELLGRGAGVASTDNEGWTTLMLAAASRNVECLKLLLPLVDATRRSRKGATALTIAAEMGWAEGVELLLGAIESGPRGPQRRLAAARHRDDTGKTPLIAAAKARSAQCLRLLLPASDPNAADMDRQTALMWAAKSAEDEAVECLRILLPDTDAMKRDRRGWTALDLAVVNGRPEAVELLSRQIDPMARDKEGRSVFEKACERGGEDGERICQALRRAIAENEREELSGAAGETGSVASDSLRPRSL